MFELIGIIVSSVAAVVTGYMTHEANRSKRQSREAVSRAQDLEQQEQFHAFVVSFARFFAKNIAVADQLRALRDTTEIDRILMFRAREAASGESGDMVVNCYIQIREDGQLSYPFIELPVDSDYRRRLMDTVEHGVVLHVTSELPEERCQIGDIYRMEGVTQALWYHAITLDGPNGTKAYQYLSFATHGDKPISADTRTRIALIMAQITDLAQTYYTPRDLKAEPSGMIA